MRSSINEEDRVDTQNNELNRVLGGGLVKGSMTLLGGEPGIGKSTLLLQVALGIPKKVLYVSGEESQSQIKMRAERLQSEHNNCLVLTETKTQNIFKSIEEIAPEIVGNRFYTDLTYRSYRMLLRVVFLKSGKQPQNL